MESLHCFCGVEIAGADGEAFFLAFREHLDQAHGWQPPDELLRVMLREVLAQQAQMAPWDGTLLPVPARLDIRPLTPARLEDFLQFFDREGFSDNPFWASCYCMEAHVAGGVEEWTPGEAARNRADKIALIRAGEAHGYLAYAEDRPIGWCHAAPRTSLAGLMANDEFHVDDPDSVGAIYCFVIAPPYRQQGVASRLLTEAAEGFRAEGLRIAEGYPPKETSSTAGGYHGTLEMFETAGFGRYRETPRHIIMRKTL
jgi:ribosomal protein S18 acetylase RimI-like enzyme